MTLYSKRARLASQQTLKEKCCLVADSLNPKNTLHHEAHEIGRLIHGKLLDFYTGWNELLIAGVMGGLEQDEIVPLLRDAFKRAEANPALIQLRVVEVVA